MKKTITCYRFIDYEDGKMKTLYKGHNGSRVLPMNKWLRADKKMVRDGSKGTPFLSGFHVFLNKKTAIRFLRKRFKRIKQKRIVTVECRGIRKKEHSPNDMYLADYMRIVKLDNLPKEVQNV